MSRTAVAALIAALCLAATVAPAAAQTLQAGTWTGTVSPPGDEVVDVTYEVSYDGDALSITLVVQDMGAFAFEDIEYDGSLLVFSWLAGNTALVCELEQQDDGSFEGECVDDGGTPGFLVMTPPGR